VGCTVCDCYAFKRLLTWHCVELFLAQGVCHSLEKNVFPARIISEWLK
jgi:hypothetical protein